MKKYIVKTLLLLAFQSVLVSCSKDGGVPQKKEPDDKKTEKKIPQWNKAQTTSIYFFSKFSEDKIDEANYKEISNYLKGKEFQVAVLDRSDVDLTKSFNGGVKVTSELKKYSLFNLLSIENKTIKGTTIVVNNIIKEQKSYLTNATSITTVEASFKNDIIIPLAVGTFSDASQINQLEKEFKRIVSKNRVVLLKIKKELLQTIQNKAKQVSSTYRVEKIDTQKDYSICVLSPKYWMHRKATKVKTFSNNLVCYHLQIEANVFY